MTSSDSPMDRLPPHDLEAERGALGCMLLDPQDRVPEVLEKLPAGPGTFYDLRHRDLCEVLIEMHGQRIPIDLVTVPGRLRDLGKLDACGGLAYVSGHADAVPSAANLPAYLGTLRDKLALRRILQTCSATMAKVQEAPADVEAIVAEFERDALAVGDAVTADSGDVDVKASLLKLVDDWQAAAAGNAPPKGIKTGLRALDSRCDGMRPGEVFVIAARPGRGKTTLALNIAHHVVFTEGEPVGIISLEMTGTELLTRMACSPAGVNSRDADKGTLSTDELRSLTVAIGKLSRAPLHIADRAALTIGQIASKARRWKQRKGIKLLVLDYLGLIRDSGRQRSRYEAVSDITRDMKALAKELGIPVLMLVQLNRANENEEREPRLSDLRDSGSIEQDADFVWLLHEGETTGPDLPTTVIIAKARRGPTSRADLLFRRKFTRFEDSAIEP